MTPPHTEQANNEISAQKILSDRLHLLNQNFISGMPVALVCATIILISLFPVVNHHLLFAWYATVFLVFLMRFIFFKVYQQSKERCHLHMTLFVLGTTVTAMLWGAAGTLLMPPGYFQHQTVVIVILAGISAGSMQIMAPSRIASSLYAVASILPLSLWLFLQNTKLYFLLGIAMTGYMIFMLVISKRGYELILTSLKLRYENTAINAMLEQSNKKLQVEIVNHERNEKLLAQLAAIVEFSNDGIIGLDVNGIIQSWNQGAEKLYGYHENDMLGKSIMVITTIEQHDLLQSMMTQVLNDLNFESIELERQNKYGEFISVSVTLSPIKNEKGVVIGISSMDRDISEKKKIDTIKNEFISVVSHELRTPLTAIKGSLSLLLSDKKTDSETTTRLLGIAYSNSERLIQLINDILDIEKIETGKLEFKFSLINIKEIIKLAINETKFYADKFHVEIRFRQAEDAYIEGDIDRLVQVMTNLLSNAIKFTHKLTTVDVTMAKRDDKIRVAITDHGDGIPKAFQANIFQKFTQADSSSSRLKGGTGLGLSICKGILAAHHSDIQFTTEEGKGTTFYFELQLSKEKNQSNLSQSGIH